MKLADMESKTYGGRILRDIVDHTISARFSLPKDMYITIWLIHAQLDRVHQDHEGQCSRTFRHPLVELPSRIGVFPLPKEEDSYIQKK